MSQYIHFFALRHDLLDMLAVAEVLKPIHYVRGGVFESSEPIIYNSATEIPDLGIIGVDSSVQGSFFLIADATTAFSVASVPQRRGGIRYAIDQRQNPDTVSFSPAGWYDAQIVLAGEIATCTKTPLSIALLKIMGKAIRKKKWEKIYEYHVSPQAVQILDAGGRLTTGVRVPQEYDLRRREKPL
jgi:hypothetical protein